MYNTKQQLNNVGVVAGTLLSMIPLYYVINYIISFEVLKKTRLFVLSVFNFVVLVLYFIISMGLIFKIAGAFVEMILFYDGYYNFAYIIEDLLFTMMILLLLTIPVYILVIVTGCLTYNFLKSDESDFLTNDERFNLAKFAGINLVSIPFYHAIKLCIEMEMIKQIDESKNGLIVAFLVLLGSTILLSWVPLIGGLISMGFLVVGIVLGVQFTDLKDTIIAMDDANYKENYDKFVSF